MATTVNAMPYNRDAEMALLGCFLIDSEVASDIVEELVEDDFYQESHKYVLRAMKKVFNTHRPIDLVTVSDELEAEGSLEKAGGITYLTELTQITPSSANYKAVHKAYAMIDRAVTGANNITFYCYTKKPTVNIPVLIKGV